MPISRATSSWKRQVIKRIGCIVTCAACDGGAAAAGIVVVTACDAGELAHGLVQQAAADRAENTVGCISKTTTHAVVETGIVKESAADTSPYTCDGVSLTHYKSGECELSESIAASDN